MIPIKEALSVEPVQTTTTAYTPAASCAGLHTGSGTREYRIGRGRDAGSAGILAGSDKRAHTAGADAAAWEHSAGAPDSTAHRPPHGGRSGLGHLDARRDATDGHRRAAQLLRPRPRLSHGARHGPAPVRREGPREDRHSVPGRGWRLA